MTSGYPTVSPAVMSDVCGGAGIGCVGCWVVMGLGAMMLVCVCFLGGCWCWSLVCGLLLWVVRGGVVYGFGVLCWLSVLC